MQGRFKFKIEDCNEDFYNHAFCWVLRYFGEILIMIQRRKEEEAGYSVVNDKTFIEEFDYEIPKTVAADCGVKDMASRCRLKLCQKIVEADMEARRGPRSRKQTCKPCLTKLYNI